MDIKPLLIAAGIPEYAMTHDIAEEAEIRNRMIPLVAALFSKIFINNFISMLFIDNRQNQTVQYADTGSFCCSKDPAYNTSDYDHNQKQTWNCFKCHL